MFSTDFIFRQQENLVDNQKYQAGFRPLCNKILFGFVQFHHLRIEDLQNFSAFLGSVSILSENLRELIKIRNT